MCVWKQHGATPLRRIITNMQNKAKELLDPGITFRTQMRLTPEHFHFHVNVNM